MAAGDVVRADGLGIGSELAELQPVVAANARVGRAAPVVLVDEVVDDAAEVFLEVQHVKGDTEHPRPPPGVVGVEDGTAALLVSGTVRAIYFARLLRCNPLR